MFGNANALNIESVLEESVVNRGWRQDYPIPLSSLRDASVPPAVLTGSTKPDIFALATSSYGVKWDATDAVTDTMEFEFTLPGDYAQDERDLIVIVPCRKRTTEQATLGLQAQIYGFQPGRLNDPSVDLTGTAPTLTAGETSLVTLTTPAKSLLPALDSTAANTNLAGFCFLELDIGERLIAESKKLLASSVVRFVIGPSATVGTSVVLDALPPIVRLRRHANMFAKRDRWMDKPIV